MSNKPLLWLSCLIIAAACHSSPRPRPALPPANVRIATAMAAWGDALARHDRAALLETEDGAGKFAIVYAAIKAGASHVPGGAQAVEETVFDNVALLVLQSLFPAAFGEPGQVALVALPGGSHLVLPWDETIGRIEAASARHREKLRANRAWSCVPTGVERTLSPSDPILQRGRAISPHIFAEWLDDVDALWIVRASCDSGAAVFIVTGHVESGVPRDRVLAAKLLPSA
jgi:hypothetical protein